MTIRNRATSPIRGHRRVLAKGMHARVPIRSRSSARGHHYNDATAPTGKKHCEAEKRARRCVKVPKRILYRRPPRSRTERLRRRVEQRSLAHRRGKNWNALSSTQKLRRVRFGSHAYCRNPRDVRDLATLNAKIAHEGELRAVQTWRLNRRQRRHLERVIGFAASDRLLASNKLVRIETARRLARLMARLFRRSEKHFYWVTLIHDGWHDSHNATWIDLQDMRTRVDRVLHGLDVSWFGLVEIDIFNNYPSLRRGLRVTPHVHLLVWTDEPITPAELVSQMHTSLLESELGARVAVVKRVRSETRLAHLCYYMTKANYRLKRLGMVNPNTGKQKTYSVEWGARPGQILRLAEILSYIEIGELMLAKEEGQRIRSRLLRSLVSSPAVSSDPCHAVGDLAHTWQDLMPSARRPNAFVHIVREPR